MTLGRIREWAEVVVMTMIVADLNRSHLTAYGFSTMDDCSVRVKRDHLVSLWIAGDKLNNLSNGLDLLTLLISQLEVELILNVNEELSGIE